MKLKTLLTAIALSVSAFGAGQAAARDYISIVGSSTVYPFATVVAEKFGKSTSYSTPKIESTGSGGGMKLFCAGVGAQHPDITNASRRMKKSEQEKCAQNGIRDIIEVKVGYDGIAIANSKKGPSFGLSRKDVFLALAKQIPGSDGKLTDNPHKTWKDVNMSLPDTRIEVLGPPPTSGTRDAFAELAMEGGARQFADLEALRKAAGEDEVKSLMQKLDIPMSAYNKKGKKVFKAVAHAIREDGTYIEAGENDNLIVQKLDANPDALGIFGFSFLDQNADKVKGSRIDGVDITFDSIADGSYPVSRPLYFYVKNLHIGTIPGIEGYLKEFTSARAWGNDGYLADKGMIPMPADERREFGSNVQELRPMGKL